MASAHAGDEARKTGDFVCENCGAQVHVDRGHPIPKCPNCGSETYNERRHEPANPSTPDKYK